MRSIWEHRQVLRMLVQRDLQRRYSKFRLGYLWTLLEPLGMSVVLWFVFSILLGPRGLGLQPYLLFLSLAILPWWWFSKGINSSTKVFAKNGGQLRVSLLPTQLWVLRVVLVSTVEFIFSLPVILIALAVTGFWPGPLIALFPVAIIVQFFLMYGLALLVASSAVVIPDLARIVKIILRAMFYLSPVLYSVSNIPEEFRTLAELNPLVGIFGMYRVGFWPEEVNSLLAFGISITAAVLLFIVGVVVFRRIEPRILKEA